MKISDSERDRRIRYGKESGRKHARIMKAAAGEPRKTATVKTWDITPSVDDYADIIDCYRHTVDD